MDQTRETVAEYVDRMRRRKELTWKQVAEALSVSEETLRRWAEADWRPMRLDKAFALVDLIPELDLTRLNARRHGADVDLTPTSAVRDDAFLALAAGTPPSPSTSTSGVAS